MNTDHYKSLVTKLPLLKAEIGKVIIGQQEAIDEVLITLLAGGHCLLEGVPGLAKTLLVSTLARTLSMSFKRIQFTPDLMPGDIVGTEVLEEDHNTGKKFFQFNKGPIFANVVLADEINRTPPKTQAALLEAMQEYKVTYAGTDYPLPRPFMIIATQNPIEQAGTYPLPEAQLDRFLLYIRLGYPSEQEELAVLRATTGTDRPVLSTILTDADVSDLQTLTRQVFISDELLGYVNRLVRASRPADSAGAVRKTVVRLGGRPPRRAGPDSLLESPRRAERPFFGHSRRHSNPGLSRTPPPYRPEFPRRLRRHYNR